MFPEESVKIDQWYPDIDFFEKQSFLDDSTGSHVELYFAKEWPFS